MPAETEEPSGMRLLWQRFADALRASPAWVGAVPLVVLLALVAVQWLRSPIVAYDTDLWYHLADGRLISETREIPWRTSFSFLAPDRTWVNYFWLFQVLVHAVWTIGGFGGLVVLRAAAFVAVLAALGWGLVSRSGSKLHWLVVGAVLAGYISILAPRYLVVRPHTVSYLALAIFVVVIARGSRRVHALPLVALLWANVHGITYPVLLLVSCALLANYVGARLAFSGASETAAPRPTILLAVLGSVLAVLATPHGRNLLPLPFVSTAFAKTYIAELRPFDWADAVRFSPLAPTLPLGWALTALAALALGGVLVRPRVLLERPGILVLAVGGLGLFVRGGRFSIELAILLLPLIRELLAAWPRRASAGVVLVPSLVILCGSATIWTSAGVGRWSYPLAQYQLPIGVAELIARDPLPARVMNHPNTGGYLLWRLPEHVTFAMDMKVPFVFLDIDMFFATGFYRDEVLFDRIVREHQPTYIMVPLEVGDFDARLRDRAPQYRLVLFDDTSALYADAKQRPDLRTLTQIDPFRYYEAKTPELTAEEERALLEELVYVLSFHPTAEGPNQLRAVLANRAGRWVEGERAARIVVESSPTIAMAWLHLGDALMGQDRTKEAMAAYRGARRVARDDSSRRLASRSLGLAYASRGDARRAFRHLREGPGIFDLQATSEQQEILADTAFATGDHAIALQLLEFALAKTSPADEARRLHLEARLARSRDLAAER